MITVAKGAEVCLPLGEDALEAGGVESAGRCVPFLGLDCEACPALRSAPLGKALFEHNPAVLLLIDPTDRTLVAVNPAAATWYGLSLDELQGQRVDRIWLEPGVVVGGKLELVGRDGVGTFEVVHRRADGACREVEVRASAVPVDGHTLVFAVVQDVTERHQLAAELVQRDRLEVLRAVAGGIAHDFNNVLTTVGGNVELARQYLRDGQLEELDALLVEVGTAAGSAVDITRQLLGFTAEEAPRVRATSLAGLLDSALGFHLRGSGVAPHLELAADLPPVLGDRGQLYRVFGNLILNARQAMGDQGSLGVAAAVRPVRGQDLLPLAPGRYVEVVVQDTGPGIPENIRQRMFDPFFTTRADGHGLGLSSCLHILQQHGGHLVAESPPEGGARFRVLLPVAPGAAVSEPAPPSAEPALGTRRVLVVDDERSIGRLLARIVRRAGAEVEAVTDGATAYTRILEAAAEGRPFELALLDLTIPGGEGGRELAPRLRDIAPGLKIVAMSGHSDAPPLLDPEAHGFDAALPKPFPVEAVAGVLGRLLPG